MIRKIFNAFAVIGVLFVLTVGAVRAADVAVSSAAPPSDAVTAQQVYDALNKDPVHYFRHVHVHARNGVVTLRGYVWSTEALYRAEKIASGVPGVTRVVNQMELERNGPGSRS